MAAIGASAATPRVPWQMGFSVRFSARNASKARSEAQPSEGWQAGFARRYPAKLVYPVFSARRASM